MPRMTAVAAGAVLSAALKAPDHGPPQSPLKRLRKAWLIPSAPMFSLPPSVHTCPLRGCVSVVGRLGGGAVMREIWPYKPVAHSPARR